MKRKLIVLLLICVSLVTAAARRRFVPKPTAAGGVSITADTWQDFEIASVSKANLEAENKPNSFTWTLFGTTSLLSISTSASMPVGGTVTAGGTPYTDSGTKGLISDISGTNTASRAIYLTIAQGSSAVSYAFPVQFVSTPNSISSQEGIFEVTGAGGSPQFQLRITSDGSGVPGIILAGTAEQTAITLSQNHAYWVTVKATKSSTVSLRIYDFAGGVIGSQQGTEATATANAQDAQFAVIGGFNSTLALGLIYYDNLLVNYTTATYPLIPQ